MVTKNRRFGMPGSEEKRENRLGSRSTRKPPTGNEESLLSGRCSSLLKFCVIAALVFRGFGNFYATVNLPHTTVQEVRAKALSTRAKATLDPLPPPPVWSATAYLDRQQRQAPGNAAPGNAVPAEEAATIKWRRPGKGKQPIRQITELLAFGLASMMPYFGHIVPALRIVGNFTTQPVSEIALVPNLVDSTVDLHECRLGRTTPDGSTVQDGKYNACFPTGADTGRKACRKQCYKAHEPRAPENRIKNHPAPGHELWSCSDLQILQQMVALEVLDYFVRHGDRFYLMGTNNIFFLRDQPTTRFVSIDHDAKYTHNLSWENTYETTHIAYLRNYSLPKRLEQDLQEVHSMGKEGFSRGFNASIYGLLDPVDAWVVRLSSESTTRGRRGKQLTNDFSIVDVIWRRLESVVDFYNLTTLDH